ncbi:hypothetical protein L915_10659 [Phytophthora nicotianae]|uniref:Uncharacterized protein n=1 Tax=Phytophthora nicotianae TaxID=4792 RepID=W2GMZ0_PHYNI|nr:hypothetical protein L915_10659 [Phytophthora nicotianae]ETL37808.1 hypothetical protein L916_10549 [Phytophthora nicotianae]
MDETTMFCDHNRDNTFDERCPLSKKSLVIPGPKSNIVMVNGGAHARVEKS